MNIHLLEVFYNVGKYQSISKAADALFVSQPAISSQIKKLEQTYNVKLIRKNGRGITLTYLGEQLYDIIYKVFSVTLLDAEYLLEDSHKITVYGNYMMTNYVVPKVLTSYTEENNETTVLIRTMPSRVAIQELKNGNCDVALVSSIEKPIEDDQFNVVKIFTDEIVLISQTNLQNLSKIVISKSKRYIRDMYVHQNREFECVPILMIESTQDAIINTQINPSNGTFTSKFFTHYLTGHYNYKNTKIRNTFYAVYEKKNTFKVEIEKLVTNMSSYFQ